MPAATRNSVVAILPPVISIQVPASLFAARNVAAAKDCYDVHDLGGLWA